MCGPCGRTFATGLTEYRCCGEVWQEGERKLLEWGGRPVCPDCAGKPAGACALCQSPVTPAASHALGYGKICFECADVATCAWCPLCDENNANYRGPLLILRKEGRETLHAAALLEHYWRCHVEGGERARRAAGKDLEEIVAARATRDYLAEVAGKVRSGDYPKFGAPGALELLEGFRRLCRVAPSVGLKLGGDETRDSVDAAHESLRIRMRLMEVFAHVADRAAGLYAWASGLPLSGLLAGPAESGRRQ